jgi:hypothetical protein
METELLTIIGRLVLWAGGGSVVAVGVFRFLGKSYIDHKFAARLESLKHDQSVIIQRLKVEIESMLSGALKFQEREFTVLPDTWAKLDLAYTNIAWLVSPIQSGLDVQRLGDIELEEQLAAQEWSESQKQQVRDADRNDRNKVYADIRFWYKLGEVKRSLGEYQKCIAANAIFYPPELKAKLKDIENMLWSAIVSKEIGKEAEDWKLENQGWTKMEEEAKALRAAIELEIRARLESHMKAAQRSDPAVPGLEASRTP